MVQNIQSLNRNLSSEQRIYVSTLTSGQEGFYVVTKRKKSDCDHNPNVDKWKEMN